MYATLILEFDSDQISYYQSSNLHGYLMESIDSRYAQLLHTNHLNPYSQYVMKENGRTYWHINTLNAEAYEKIILPLSKVKQVTIKNGSIVAPVISTQMSVQREQELLNEFYNTHSNGYLEISFLTPTAFKKDGRYIFYPDLNLLYGSLMRKYTENSQSMSMFDTDTLNELAKRSEIVRYRIQTVPFPLEKVRITGFIGTICIHVKGNETMARYARMLFSFGEYSGIGIKAGMGMGALRLSRREKDEG